MNYLQDLALMKTVETIEDQIVPFWGWSLEPIYIWRHVPPNGIWRIPRSDEIFEELRRRGKLKNRHFSLFSAPFCNLNRRALLRDMKLDVESLQYIFDKPMHEVDVSNVTGIDLAELIDILSEKSQETLKSLIATGISLNVDSVGSLNIFVSLVSLNLSHTDLDEEGLAKIADVINELEELDISDTRVHDISCLEKWKDSLTILNLSNLNLPPECVLTLTKLIYINVLDISITWEIAEALKETFSSSTSFPNIREIGFGYDTFPISADDIRQLIKNHPQLEFIGFPERSIDGIFELIEEYSNIKFAGCNALSMILNLFHRYCDQECYILNGIEALEYCDVDYQRTEVVEALLGILKRFPSMLRQCLRQLKRITDIESIEDYVDLSNFLPAETVVNGVETVCETVAYCTLDTFEARMSYRILSNMLRIGGEDMHKIRMFKMLVIATPKEEADEDPRLYEKQAALINELADMMSQDELIAVGTDESVMRFLLRCIARSAYYDMDKCLFQTLFKIISGSYESQEVFVHLGGLNIFYDLFKAIGSYELSSYDDRKAATVNGIMAVVAVIAANPDFKIRLITNTNLEKLCDLVRRNSFKRHHFASKIICNLVCTPDECWEFCNFTKSSMLNTMWDSVFSRKHPYIYPYVYTSYESFRKLITNPNCCFEVIHWVLMSIFKTLTKEDLILYYKEKLEGCSDLMRCILFFAFLTPSDFDRISPQSYNEPFPIPIEDELPYGWLALAEEIHLEWQLSNCMQDSQSTIEQIDESAGLNETYNSTSYYHIERASKNARHIINELLILEEEEEEEPTENFSEVSDDSQI